MLTKERWIKSAVISVAEHVLGAHVELGSLEVRPREQTVRLKDLIVHNPAGFPEGKLIDLAEIRAHYNFCSILRGRMHFFDVAVDMREMVVIKNKDGKLNVDGLRVAQKNDSAQPARRPQKSSRLPAQAAPLQIDRVTLTLGKVIVKDYTKGPSPVTEVFNPRIRNKTYTKITGVEQFAVLILVEAMRPAALKGAAIFGAATVLGLGFMPAGIAGILLSNDSGTAYFQAGLDQVRTVVREILRKSGHITQDNKATGTIKATVQRNNIAVTIKQKNDILVEVKVSARKLLIPKPQVAQGILYEITEQLR